MRIAGPFGKPLSEALPRAARRSTFHPNGGPDSALEGLQSLRNKKTAKALTHSGVNHLRFRLRSTFTLAVSEGVVERNPAVSLFAPRRCKESREKLVLTPEDISRIMAALDLRERLVVQLATLAGMRLGEILGLQIGDVDGDSVWVRRRLYRGTSTYPKPDVRLDVWRCHRQPSSCSRAGSLACTKAAKNTVG